MSELTLEWRPLDATYTDLVAVAAAERYVRITDAAVPVQVPRGRVAPKGDQGRPGGNVDRLAIRAHRQAVAAGDAGDGVALGGMWPNGQAGVAEAAVPVQVAVGRVALRSTLPALRRAMQCWLARPCPFDCPTCRAKCIAYTSGFT